MIPFNVSLAFLCDTPSENSTVLFDMAPNDMPADLVAIHPESDPLCLSLMAPSLLFREFVRYKAFVLIVVAYRAPTAIAV